MGELDTMYTDPEGPDEEPEITSLQVINTQDGPGHDPYRGIAQRPFTDKQRAILIKSIDEEREVSIRPDGLIYMPEIKYRRRLNAAFGPGGWALLPVKWAENGKTVICQARLFVDGRFIAEAIGEADYIPHNNSYTFATASEAAKSNALMRTCKDIGIASELWDPDYISEWLKRFALEVWCKTKDGKAKRFWRKKTDPPIDRFPWKEEPGNQPTGRPKAQPKTQPTGSEAVSPAPAAPPQGSGPELDRPALLNEFASLLDQCKVLGIKARRIVSDVAGEVQRRTDIPTGKLVEINALLKQEIERERAEPAVDQEPAEKAQPSAAPAMADDVPLSATKVLPPPWKGMVGMAEALRDKYPTNRAFLDRVSQITFTPDEYERGERITDIHKLTKTGVTTAQTALSKEITQ